MPLRSGQKSRHTLKTVTSGWNFRRICWPSVTKRGMPSGKGSAHREILILYHFQNLRYDQIAAILMCNKGTVMSRLYNARKQLKERLEQQKGVLEL